MQRMLQKSFGRRRLIGPEEKRQKRKENRYCSEQHRLLSTSIATTISREDSSVELGRADRDSQASRKASMGS
jgi:hypothetical protein